MDNEKVYAMSFAKIYPLLVNKAVRKGRTKAEVDEIIRWLTGYSQADLENLPETSCTYGDFFRNAPHLNENRKLIKGVFHSGAVKKDGVNPAPVLLLSAFDC